MSEAYRGWIIIWNENSNRWDATKVLILNSVDLQALKIKIDESEEKCQK